MALNREPSSTADVEHCRARSCFLPMQAAAQAGRSIAIPGHNVVHASEPRP